VAKQAVHQSIPTSRSMLLLLDGHSSHYNLEAIKLAAENEIIHFCLLSHTTHVAQPLDVSFFGPLKKTGLECVMNILLTIMEK